MRRLRAGVFRVQPPQLNQRAAAVASSDYTPKPAEVAYAVGQVLRECGSGVRVAVAGYDLSSAREGAEEFDVALGAQPHYHVLADVRDLAATGAVGSTLPLGARAASQTAYLPQTALVPLTTSACDDDGFVLHPLLATYFTEFNCATGAFVPAGPVAALYADDAFAAAAAAGLAPTSRVAASAAAVRTGTSVRALLAALEERAAAVHRATAAGAARATVDDDGDRAAASDDDDDEPEEDADAAAARGAKWGRS